MTAANGRFNGLRRRLKGRRGVAAVLAMMFLILFGSLSVAMAISSKGNITTAATHLHVSRAQSAAETGLSVARARLANAAARFVISKSNVDATFGWNLWSGNLAALGQSAVMRPRTGRQDLALPNGLAAAVAEDHAQDQGIVTEVGVASATVGNAPAGYGSDYKSTNWVFTPAVAVEPRVTGAAPPLAYSITYAPLANGTDVRAIVTGYDFAYARAGQPVKRVICQDFRVAKRVKSAIVSPSRIMIGKNVMVSGDVGSRYMGVNYAHGNPLTLKSDFFGLDPVLDQKLTAFYAGLAQYDVDGDNRLRVSHPVESVGIPSGATDYDGDGHADQAFDDVTGDGYVDEFDLFIRNFDRNGDGKIALSHALTAGTPAAGEAPELVDHGGNVIDEDLALLIDSSNPDRNKNGIFGFIDTNRNGRWDSGETMLDYDSSTNRYRDQVLGYRDGFIDKKDQYAKVAGQISFKVDKSAWTTAQGALGAILRGSIAPADGKSPTSFQTSDTDLPDLNVAIFGPAQSNLQADADGATFNQQVATQLGVSTGALAAYVESHSASYTGAKYQRLDADTNLDGLPDNWGTAYFEKMPFNSPTFTDYYYRPVYENMTFKDVQIPAGTNALFKNCTFVGVTYVRCEMANTHVLWNEYGKMVIPAGQTRPQPKFARMIYGNDAGETHYPTTLPSSAIPPTQMILMSQNQPLDQADLPSDVSGSVANFTSLPLPLVISGKRVTDTKTLSNNLRFHDCLFVGSITSDAPQGYTQVRNKVVFTGATQFVKQHPTSPDDPSLNPQAGDMADIKSSSMMLPNYSVDLGSYNSPPTQNLQLSGAIIAGVLDIRGNATIDGALLMTFSPVLGQGPRDALNNPAGNPANFNTTIGYFGPADGEQEGLDPATLPIINGVRVAGWDTDGDGLVDVAADQAQPAGSTAVPFYGYGRIQLRFDPKMAIPSGIMLPMTMEPVVGTYKEGKP